MDVFLGMITLFGFAFAPKGWMFCAGQLLPVSSNAALFSLLGSTYGGDGQTNFNLPDLRGRTAIGVGPGSGLSPNQLGQKGGVETTALSLAQMPPHSHVASAASTSTSTSILYAEGTAANALNPNGNMLASGLNNYATEDAQNNRAMSSQAVATTTITNTTVQIGPAGGGLPFSTMPPYLVLNYCIAVEGLFPSRN